MNVPKWVVHHIGPDDVFPADGMLDAIKKAHAINKGHIENGGYFDTAVERPYMTFGFAVPKRETEMDA